MDILNTLFEISVYSIILFGAILLAKKAVGKKMSPSLHYFVWFILIARLLMPFTPDSGLRLIQIPAFAAIQTEQSAASASINASAPSVQAVNATGQAAVLTAQAAGDASKPDASVQDLPQQSLSPAAANRTAEAPGASAVDLPTILLAVWLTGAGGYAVYMLLSWMLLRIKVRREGFEPTAHLTALLKACKRSLGVRGNIKIVGTCDLATPALFAPRTILMPMEIILSGDDERILFALQHELTHYRRGDHIVSVLLSVLQAVYWFNPIVWLMARQMRTDMEVACDNAVAQKLNGSEKNSYAHLIVSMFAGKPQGRMLGMASGNTRKTAEKRVRGIFAAGRSRTGVKAAAFIITAALAVSCFTTACQPVQIAEKGPYQNESAAQATINSNSTAAASPSPSIALPYSAPKTYSNTFNKDTNTLTINAAVEVPDITEFPVYNVQSAPFTQAEADTFAKVLMQGKSVVNQAKPLTKAQLETMLESEKNTDTSENIRADGKDPLGRTKEQLDQLKAQNIAKLEEEIKTAPETAPKMKGTTLAGDPDGSLTLQVTADLGKTEPARLSMSYEPQYGSSIIFTNCYDSYDFGQDTPEGVKITRDQAVAKAQKTIADLGYSQDFSVSGVDAGVSPSWGSRQCYMVVFMRRIGNIPFTYVSAGQINTERILVCVDDTGITEVAYYGKMKVMDQSEQKAKLMPFDEIIQIFGKEFLDRYSMTDQAKKDPLSPIKSTYTFNRITLGYTQISSKDQPGKSQLMPVWDFFGSVRYEYDMDAVKKALIKSGRSQDQIDKDLKNYNAVQDKGGSAGSGSFFTINAIDGSFVDRNSEN